jgi:hypothetical protein
MNGEEQGRGRTLGLVRYGCFRVENAEGAHELAELDDAVPLEVEEVEHPVCEEVRAFAGPEEGELELLLRNPRQDQRS